MVADGECPRDSRLNVTKIIQISASFKKNNLCKRFENCQSIKKIITLQKPSRTFSYGLNWIHTKKHQKQFFKTQYAISIFIECQIVRLLWQFSIGLNETRGEFKSEKRKIVWLNRYVGENLVWSPHCMIWLHQKYFYCYNFIQYTLICIFWRESISVNYMKILARIILKTVSLAAEIAVPMKTELLTDN